MLKKIADSEVIQLFKKAAAHFQRTDIAMKMLLGYIPLFLLLIFISAMALYSLSSLNNLNESVLKTDIPAREVAGKMVDAVLAQELFLRRYVILKTPEMLDIYQSRNSEFSDLLNKLKALPHDLNLPVEQIAELHQSYNNLLIQGLDFMENPESAKAREFEKSIKKKQDQIISLVKEIEEAALTDQNIKTQKTANIGSSAFKFSAVLCAIGLFLSIAAALIVTRNIAGAIKKLQVATEKISEGEFDYEPDIQNKDELGDLKNAFITMAKRLKELEELYRDASPLTRLPGGVAVENVLSRKIANYKPLAFCLLDIDNFKSYNDHYGYARGNDLILAVAFFLEEAVAAHGSEDDFIGHIGGDDFVLITTPDRYEKTCRAVLDDFSENVLEFYNQEDRDRGYLIGENRQGDQVTFPMASISIAVVTNQRRIFANHIQVGEIAADLKEYAKSITGSTLVVDKRYEPIIKNVNRNKVVKFPGKSGLSSDS